MNLRFFGDSRVAGVAAAADTFISLIGDIEIDVRGEALPESLRSRVFSIIGDTTVRVPAGTAVEITGFSIIGDRGIRREGDGSGPAAEGSPSLSVRAYALLGDVKVVVDAGS